MIKLNRIHDEVYTTVSDIVSLDMHDIAFLKEKVAHCPHQRIRICAHQASTDLLHEMLIVIAKGCYIRPHKHLNKSESFHIIEGCLDVVIFDEEGQVLNVIPMGNPASGKKFFYRLSAAYFHTLILRSDLVIFHETTNGPFLKQDTICAPWSPAEGDRAQEEKFMRELDTRILQPVMSEGRD